MVLGSRVRERRTALGFSQENLAHRAGVSLNAVHKLEAGRITDPHFSTLSGIAHALGMTVAQLVGEEQMAGTAAPLAEASEAGPREHSFTDALKGLRHAVDYHAYQKALDQYRERWEVKLADDDLKKAVVEEAGHAIRVFWPALETMAKAEVAELQGLLGLDREAAETQSVLLPAMARFRTLGAKINRAYCEEFHSNVIELFPQQKAS